MQQTVQQRPFAAPAAPTRRAAPRAARGLATGNGAGPLPVQAKLAEGARIKVTAPIKVYHVGKFKSGLELQGLEAVVVQPDVRDFKYKDGKQHELSANLPVKVQFMIPAPDGGKDVKVIAHLAEEELEAL